MLNILGPWTNTVLSYDFSRVLGIIKKFVTFRVFLTCIISVVMSVFVNMIGFVWHAIVIYSMHETKHVMEDNIMNGEDFMFRKY